MKELRVVYISMVGALQLNWLPFVKHHMLAIWNELTCKTVYFWKKDVQVILIYDNQEDQFTPINVLERSGGANIIYVTDAGYRSLENSGVKLIGFNSASNLLPLQPPELLTELISTGFWPKSVKKQEFQPIIGKEAAQRLSPNESKIILVPPPFRTLGDDVRLGHLYAFTGVLYPPIFDFDRAVEIADFGIGSDAPIVLYFHTDSQASIMYLSYTTEADKSRREWVDSKLSFEEFAELVDLRNVLTSSQ